MVEAKRGVVGHKSLLPLQYTKKGRSLHSADPHSATRGTETSLHSTHSSPVNRRAQQHPPLYSLAQARFHPELSTKKNIHRHAHTPRQQQQRWVDTLARPYPHKAKAGQRIHIWQSGKKGGVFRRTSIQNVKCRLVRAATVKHAKKNARNRGTLHRYITYARSRCCKEKSELLFKNLNRLYSSFVLLLLLLVLSLSGPFVVCYLLVAFHFRVACHSLYSPCVLCPVSLCLSAFICARVCVCSVAPTRRFLYSTSILHSCASSLRIRLLSLPLPSTPPPHLRGFNCVAWLSLRTSLPRLY